MDKKPQPGAAWGVTRKAVGCMEVGVRGSEAKGGCVRLSHFCEVGVCTA